MEYVKKKPKKVRELLRDTAKTQEKKKKALKRDWSKKWPMKNEQQMQKFEAVEELFLFSQVWFRCFYIRGFKSK